MRSFQKLLLFPQKTKNTTSTKSVVPKSEVKKEEKKSESNTTIKKIKVGDESSVS